MAKETYKDYDYYTMNFPNSMRILFETFIWRYPNLGFKNVSQFALHVLQQKAAEIIKENPDLAKIDKITLPSGTYELQENGNYKRIE